MKGSNMTTQATCKDRVAKHLRGRVKDIRKLWEMYQRDPELSDEELGVFNEYGLCFDYVAPGTFRDQKRGYFRYQLSTGGPGDEFRFYCDENLRPARIEYWFLDWYDGAKIILHGKDEALLSEIFADFKEMGSVQAELDKARAS